MPGAGEHHEAVVIGAGPGGPATAPMLTEAGVESLVLECDRVAFSWRRRSLPAESARVLEAT